MRRLLDKYTGKLVDRGLAPAGGITFLGLDAELVSNSSAQGVPEELSRVFDLMSINSLLFAGLEEPYRSIVEELIAGESQRLTPADCETRTFFHDIPLIDGLDAGLICRALSRRKAAIVRGRGIVSCGTVSPEQAFVSFSSVCFSTFVKYFSDFLFSLDERGRNNEPVDEERFARVRDMAAGFAIERPDLQEVPDRPPENGNDVCAAMAGAGRALVRSGLIDSYFGNISYAFGDRIFITQTGSSMDELESCIDAVPLDGSSSSGITASSELSAHLGISRKTGKKAIVHGHPKFTVIMSMSCRRPGCDLSACYTKCTVPRSLLGAPVVSGEIGTGSAGLSGTVPAAFNGNDAVVVYGHGIFAVAPDSFPGALETIGTFERRSRGEYLRLIEEKAGR